VPDTASGLTNLLHSKKKVQGSDTTIADGGNEGDNKKWIA